MDFLTWGIKVSLIFFLNKSLKEITVFFELTLRGAYKNWA